MRYTFLQGYVESLLIHWFWEIHLFFREKNSLFSCAWHFPILRSNVFVSLNWLATTIFKVIGRSIKLYWRILLSTLTVGSSVFWLKHKSTCAFQTRQMHDCLPMWLVLLPLQSQRQQRCLYQWKRVFWAVPLNQLQIIFNSNFRSVKHNSTDSANLNFNFLP